MVIDTLRADAVSAARNGVPVMPNLYALAQESWYFDNAYAQAAWTKPSVVSILTSLYPGTHRVCFGAPRPRRNPDEANGVDGIPDGIETAPGFFRKHGYKTAVVQTNRNLLPQYGFDQGCDFYDDLNWAAATEVTDRALARVEELTEPFFLYAHYFDPHSPYDPPEPHRSVFGPVTEFEPKDAKWNSDDIPFRAYYLDKIAFDIGRKPVRQFEDLGEQSRDRFRVLYDGECHFVDAEVHRLLNGIKAQRPNTVVVVVADHGEEFWDHGSIGHSRTVYQEVVHVPLILSIPNNPPQRVTQTVQTIDILPTLSAAAGIFPRRTWQGISLLNSTIPKRPAFAQAFGTYPESGIDKTAVINGPLKLIRDHDKNSECYNVLSDSAETTNLLDSVSGSIGALDKTLDRHRLAVTNHPAAKIAPASAELAPELLEQLRALGYVGDSPGPD